MISYYIITVDDTFNYRIRRVRENDLYFVIYYVQCIGGNFFF